MDGSFVRNRHPAESEDSDDDEEVRHEGNHQLVLLQPLDEPAEHNRSGERRTARGHRVVGDIVRVGSGQWVKAQGSRVDAVHEGDDQSHVGEGQKQENRVESLEDSAESS